MPVAAGSAGWRTVVALVPVLAVALLGWGGPAGVAGEAVWTRLGTVDEPAIAESSGLAASRRQPGVFWTHNDSGDDPVLYAIDDRGRFLAAFWVNGAEHVDWEDLALGPAGETGGPDALYVADVGDNGLVRSEIALYRVPEPMVGDAVGAVDAERFVYAYPDGAHDAEALLVDPIGGEVVVATKEGEGGAALFRLPWPEMGGPR